MADINLEIGPHEGHIVSHRTRMVGDKTAVSLAVTVGREQAEALVFITDKAMGMARRALKLCGFDCDKDDLILLDVQPTKLAGNKVPLVVEMYNGRKQLKVDLDGRADKATLSDLTKKLREVKKSKDEVPDDSRAESVPEGYVPDHGIPF